jgi:hypothetical protein
MRGRHLFWILSLYAWHTGETSCRYCFSRLWPSGKYTYRVPYDSRNRTFFTVGRHSVGQTSSLSRLYVHTNTHTIICKMEGSATLGFKWVPRNGWAAGKLRSDCCQLFFHICVSVHHQSIILINQLDGTLCSLIYSLLRFTMHVSGAFCTHH